MRAKVESEEALPQHTVQPVDASMLGGSSKAQHCSGPETIHTPWQISTLSVRRAETLSKPLNARSPGCRQ